MKLSFRTKLILAMSIIVVGVTGATVLVTQRRVQETYSRLFEEQFQGQIGYFYEKQALRLDTVMSKSEELAQSESLIGAVERGESRSIYETVFVELRDLLRELGSGEGPRRGFGRGFGGGGTNAFDPFASQRREYLQQIATRLGSGGGGGGPQDRRGSGQGPNAPGGPGGGPGRRGELVMVRVIDANGELFQTEDSRAGLAGRMSASQADVMRAFMARVTGTNTLSEQEVGYLAIEGEDGRTRLREFVVTPIIRPATKKVVGALVLGLPLPDFGEQFLFDFTRGSTAGQILSGIWLGGRIHTQTIPEDVRNRVAAVVAGRLESAVGPERSKGETTIDINGVPYRVFHKVLNPNSAFPPAAEVCLYSLAAVRAEQRDLRLRIGGFGLIALVGAFGVIMLISHGLTVPIRHLVRGTGEVLRGNYDVEVPVRSRDEIGELTTSFNEMAKGLALNRRYQMVLAQVADRDVAEAMMRGDLALGGEMRRVSVLFCDIRGFTALTQSLPPEAIIELLNEHMTALTQVVYDHHGVVDKFVGDLIMAVFGAPKSYDQDALNAARCAVSMIEVRRRLNEKAQTRVDIGIGLATGEVVAGCMGSQDRLNYTVLGDRVNLAARLCSHAGRGEIIVDEATADAVRESVRVEPLPDLLLKGFSGPVKVCRLSGRIFQTSAT